jgi:hypothetical protein
VVLGFSCRQCSGSTFVGVPASVSVPAIHVLFSLRKLVLGCSELTVDGAGAAVEEGIVMGSEVVEVPVCMFEGWGGGGAFPHMPISLNVKIVSLVCEKLSK